MTRFKDESGFNIQLYSGCEYENLVAEIYHDGKLLLVVKQEKPSGEFELEFGVLACGQGGEATTVDFDGLIVTLQEAKTLLQERRT